MTTHIARKETRCRHMGYYFRLGARFILYALSHRQDNTYHGLCYKYSTEVTLEQGPECQKIFKSSISGVGHMVKDHSDSEKGNPLPPHGLLFPINSKVFFYMHHPTDRIAHTTAFVTPVVEHWLEREIAQLD